MRSGFSLVSTTGVDTCGYGVAAAGGLSGTGATGLSGASTAWAVARVKQAKVAMTRLKPDLI